MLKKIIAGAAGATLVLTMAGAAFAHPWHHHSSDDVTVVNDATVRNRTLTVANTGNLSGGGLTGNATAVATILNDVNYTGVGCGCLDGDVTVVNNATVRNRTLTVANTGNLGGGGHTGNAVAGSSITNLVNTTVVGI